MWNRLLLVLVLAAGVIAGAGCSPSGDACRSDSDCTGLEKCLSSGGVVFGNGVCVKPCTTERLRKLCRQQGGQCSGQYCVQFQPDADAFAPDGGESDGETGPPPDTCERPTDYEFCEARGLPCGAEDNPVSGRDKCGDQRTVDCNAVIDFGTNAQHCGACGNECDFHNADGTSNADGTCKGGSCVIFACDNGYKDKDGDGSNGCECEVTEEVCDGRDNDCDGEVDEGDCECSPGDTADCYTGANGTAGTGICEKGTWTCMSDGTWGTCMGETTPESEEICDNGEDDDCDGAVDEGCDCNYKGKSAGVCADQTTDGSGNCEEPDNYEDSETSCTDGADNDCDGETDGDDGDCQCNYDGSSVGVCADATVDENGMCQEPDAYEGAESSCTDGKDNDCDGDTDAADADCQCNYDGSSVGVCADATRDNSGDCQKPSNYESPDEMSCSDGVDNDCDGAIDEGCPCNYENKSEGVCAGMTTTEGGTCPPPADYESTETSCDDGFDNDCDGATDGMDSDCS